MGNRINHRFNQQRCQGSSIWRVVTELPSHLKSTFHRQQPPTETFFTFGERCSLREPKRYVYAQLIQLTDGFGHQNYFSWNSLGQLGLLGVFCNDLYYLCLSQQHCSSHDNCRPGDAVHSDFRQGCSGYYPSISQSGIHAHYSHSSSGQQLKAFSAATSSEREKDEMLSS